MKPVFRTLALADYGSGHFPGAVNLHWTQLSNVAFKQGEPGWSVILPAQQLAKKNYGERKNGRTPGSKNIWFKDVYHADLTEKTP